MADLDDFFKKKDKKKKGEKKFAKANTDVLAKNLEQMAVKEEKAMEKEISEMNNDSPNTPLNQQLAWQAQQFKLNSKDETDDDEWDDYRENKKDYTGLKIENLTQEEPKEEEEEETEVNEDGEVVTKRKEGKDGPWNKLGDAPSNQGSMEEREEMPEQKREAVELLASSNVVGGSYVPPHMRGQAGAAAAAAATEVRRPQPRGRVMKAPDISSEVYFPSLGNSEDTAPKGAWGKNPTRGGEGAFEEVKGGDKQASVRSTESKALTLGNKFDVLGAE